MFRLEDVENKENAFYDFFTWLFDDNKIEDKSISLSSEVDFSLCHEYLDSKIYYPRQFKNFFGTKAMQRLNRISQLGLAVNTYSNLYHNRLEHSKGVYNKKLEEFFYKFQDANWKKYIEDNDLKLYLIAELIKLAGHDIGHSPLSHAFEENVFKYRGAHEDIGKRIMLEDNEIQEILYKLSPSLNSILKELYNRDILNFKEHDESNYDVDRLDYLIRDSLYLGFNVNLPLQNYETICIETSEVNKYIDVYDFSSLAEIEKLLSLREERYKNLYMSADVQTSETSISNFITAFLSTDSNVGIELRNFLTDLSTSNIDNIDLQEFLKWDEIKLYSELLDIAEQHENPNIRDLATMIIPNLHSLFNLTYSHLNCNSRTDSYSNDEKNFLKKLKKLITCNNELGNNLRNPKFTSNNIIFLPKGSSFLCENQQGLITTFNHKICPYKKAEPIYIKDKDGNIFELSNHPNRSRDWSNKNCIIETSYASIPYLKFNGISNETIDKLLEYNKQHKNCSISPYNGQKLNMNPFKVEHSAEDYFLEL